MKASYTINGDSYNGIPYINPDEYPGETWAIVIWDRLAEVGRQFVVEGYSYMHVLNIFRESGLAPESWGLLGAWPVKATKERDIFI